jgi:hypothetical protein
MNLHEIFDVSGVKDEDNSSDGESGPQPFNDTHMLCEENKIQQSKPARNPKSGTNRNSKRSVASKKMADVPSSISENEVDELESATSTRRTTKRASKKTPVLVIEEGHEDATQPPSARSTRRTAQTQPEDIVPNVRGLTVHKTTKNRRVVHTGDSEDEPPLESVFKKFSNGRLRARSRDPDVAEEVFPLC